MLVIDVFFVRFDFDSFLVRIGIRDIHFQRELLLLLIFDEDVFRVPVYYWVLSTIFRKMSYWEVRGRRCK